MKASKSVAVTKHGDRPKVTGGVVIDVPEVSTAVEWCQFHGAKDTAGKEITKKSQTAVLFKAVDDDYSTDHARRRSIFYRPGSRPVAADWDGGKAECGGGLHFSPHPVLALDFNRAATRFVACPVKVDGIVVHKDPSHPQKVKAEKVTGDVFEVDRYGDPIPVQVEKAAA